MIDIIIPIYNGKETIKEALESIRIQKNAPSFNVLLINDHGDYNYDEIVKEYSKYFNIKELYLEKNMGPGGARQNGIEASTSKYIMFIDSDDYLYDDSSLESLYKGITKNNSDLLVSNFIYERDGVKIVKKNNSVWLHGKIFKREFLEKYNIKFNNTRANEDNGFNRLVLIMNPKRAVLDKITYVYNDNKNSITRKDNRLYKFDGLDGYTYNMRWAIEEGIKRNAKRENIDLTVLSTLIAMYYYYLIFDNKYNHKKIIKWTNRIYEYYDKKSPYIDKVTIKNMLSITKTSMENEGNTINEVITFNGFLKQLSKNKIDIIVPLYNSRDDLYTFLNRIKNQTIINDCNVVLIDDASEESYDDIVELYSSILNIRYYRLKENKGPGYARQVGIEITTAPFITFIDSDDRFYMNESLMELYTSIKNSDVVVGIEFDEARKILIINDGDLHGKLYRRSFIEKHNIRFNNTRFHEDNYFNNYAYLSKARYKKIHKIVYYYHFNKQSVTKKDPKKELDRLEILFQNINELKEKVPLSMENKNRWTKAIFSKYKYYNFLYNSYDEKNKKVLLGYINKYDKDYASLIGIKETEIRKKLKEIINSKVK